MKNIPETQAGFIAVVGRPNVGKSTLLNKILGFKLSITSKKPQTTRHRLLGIKTTATVQYIYVDTPGIHKKATSALNRYLNRAAFSALQTVEVIVMVVDCTHWEADDDLVLASIEKAQAPVILAVNKIDRFKDRAELLPLIEDYQKKYNFAAIIPLSAQEGDQIPVLEKEITKYLPVSPFLFPDDQVSDKGDQFIVTEIIREKLMRSLQQELPYSLTVTLDAFVEEEKIVRISAVIWVEKESHKPIIIGKKGDHLKKIGKLARFDLENHFKKQVYLQLWVKIKSGWTDDDTMLTRLGYDE